MLTEPEAKKLWCPMIKSQSNPNFASDACRCIGAACMMWRWEDVPEQNGYCGLAGHPFPAFYVPTKAERQ